MVTRVLELTAWTKRLIVVQWFWSVSYLILWTLSLLEQDSLEFLCCIIISNVWKSCGNRQGIPKNPKFTDSVVNMGWIILSFFLLCCMWSLQNPDPPIIKALEQSVDISITPLNLWRIWGYNWSYRSVIFYIFFTKFYSTFLYSIYPLLTYI